MQHGLAVWGDAMSNALPYYPVRYDEDVYDANGNIEHEAGEYFLWFDEWGGTKNPVAVRELKEWKTTEDRSISNAQLIYSPMANLNLKVSGGLTTSTSARTSSTPAPCPSQRN